MAIYIMKHSNDRYWSSLFTESSVKNIEYASFVRIDPESADKYGNRLRVLAATQTLILVINCPFLVYAISSGIFAVSDLVLAIQFFVLIISVFSYFLTIPSIRVINRDRMPLPYTMDIDMFLSVICHGVAFLSFANATSIMIGFAISSASSSAVTSIAVFLGASFAFIQLTLLIRVLRSKLGS